MKHPNTLARALLLALICLLSLTALTACRESEWNDLSDDSDTDVLCRTFVDQTIAGDREAINAMIGHMLKPGDFEVIWADLCTLSDGATLADIHQTGWQFFTENGAKYFQSRYMVEFDTGTSMIFSVTVGEEEGVIEGFAFSDVTEFIQSSGETVDRWSVILTVWTVLMLAFTIWMLVDCIRRPMKKKPVWIILIFLGITLTFTAAPEQNQIGFFFALLVQFSTCMLNQAIPAVVTRIVIPVGPVVYFFLRKRLTRPKDAPASETPAPVPAAPVSDTYDVAESASPADIESVSPADVESASPADGESASPADIESVSPADSESASPADSESVSTDIPTE